MPVTGNPDSPDASCVAGLSGPGQDDAAPAGPSWSSVRKTDHAIILVYLANGIQGGAAARAAAPPRVRVNGVVRDPAQGRALAALGIEPVLADLRDPASLVAARTGVDHAVIQVPARPEHEMAALAHNALSACRTCGVASIVLRLASASRPGPYPEPGVVAIARVEALARASGLPVAIARPTLYLDNLLKPGVRRHIVEDGTFGLPIAARQRIAWTSVEDCAEAALTLIERGAYGGDHLVSGPESLTGDAFAALVSAGLGRPVAYAAEAVDAFEAEVAGALGALAAERIASKFRLFAADPAEADAMLARPFDPRPGLEGFRPSGVEAWTRRHRAAFLVP